MRYSHPELDSGSHNISSLSLQNEIPDQVRNDERTNDYKFQIIISTLSSRQAVETKKNYNIKYQFKFLESIALRLKAER